MNHINKTNTIPDISWQSEDVFKIYDIDYTEEYEKGDQIILNSNNSGEWQQMFGPDVSVSDPPFFDYVSGTAVSLASFTVRFTQINAESDQDDYIEFKNETLFGDSAYRTLDNWKDGDYNTPPFRDGLVVRDLVISYLQLTEDLESYVRGVNLESGVFNDDEIIAEDPRFTLELSEENERKTVGSFDITSDQLQNIENSEATLSYDISDIERRGGSNASLEVEINGSAVSETSSEGSKTETFDASKLQTGTNEVKIYGGYDESYGITVEGMQISAEVNSPPTANDLSISTKENESVSESFDASDPDGDLLSYSIQSNPSNGSVSTSGDQFTYTPDTNYSGSDSFTYKVTDSKGGSDTATVSLNIAEVQSPPNFDVSIDNTNTPITEGADLQVTATVANTGDKQGDGTLELSVSNVGNASTNVSVGGGSSTTETLTISTNTGDAGSRTATMAVSGDDSASASQTVEINEQLDGANFNISIDSTNSPITEGADLQVTATVANTGDKQGDGTLELSVSNVGNASTNVSVGGGNSTTKTLTVSTNTGDAGSRTATMAVSGDDSASASRTVNIESGTAPSLGVTGDSITVGGSANISITGEQVNQITVSNLWTDWNVDASIESGVFHNHVADEGECILGWNSQQASTSVPLTISPPDRYVGGTYILNLTASNSNATTEAQVNLEIGNDGNKTEAQISFEAAPVGAEEPADPWLVVNDPYPNYNSVEISDQHATHGSQTLHMSADGSLENLLVGVTANFSDVATILCDAYLERANNSWGYINIGSWNGNEVNRAIGVLGQTNGTGKFTNLEGDVSQWTSEHDLVFNVQGDNEAYFDNLRFLDQNGNLIPPAELNLSAI